MTYTNQKQRLLSYFTCKKKFWFRKKIKSYPWICARLRLVASPALVRADQDPPRSLVLEVVGMWPSARAFSNSRSRYGLRSSFSLPEVSLEKIKKMSLKNLLKMSKHLDKLFQTHCILVLPKGAVIYSKVRAHIFWFSQVGVFLKWVCGWSWCGGVGSEGFLCLSRKWSGKVLDDFQDILEERNIIVYKWFENW